MGSPFDALVAGVLAPVISAHFGRRFQLLPRMKATDPNAPVVPDPSRAQTIFLAALHMPKAKPLITDAYDPRTNRRPGAISRHPLLRIQPDQAVTVQTEDAVLDLDANVTWRLAACSTTEHGVRECELQVLG